MKATWLPQHPANSGAMTLDRCGSERLTVVCSQCERRGEYGVARLIERFGPRAGLPEVKDALVDCPKRGNVYYDRCQAVYADPRW